MNAPRLRVGVYRAGPPPEMGGGFTFEYDIFQSLMRAAASGGTRHAYTFFSHCDETAPSGEPLRLVKLERPAERPPQAPNRVQRLARRIATRAGWAEATAPPDVDATVRSSADAMIYLNPFDVLTRDLPYITPLWDLQHRLQPFFPEVSSEGRWDAREAHFSVHLRRATTIVTGTAVGKAEIERFYQIAPERIRVLPLPTPQFALDAAERPREPLPARFGVEPGYLFYPAQFWAHKNHASLLLALRRLEDDGLRLHLVLVGSDYGNREHIERMATSLGLRDRVHLLGFVPRAELVALYQHALALTFVSLFGPDNLPPLEAFALECPVIAANVSGAEEQLGDAALLVNGTDPGAIARSVRCIHDNAGLRAGLVQRGRARAAAFTSAQYAAGLMAAADDIEAVRRTWPQSESWSSFS